MGVKGLEYPDLLSYFEFRVMQFDSEEGITEIEVEQCTVDHWTVFGDEAQNYYDNYGMRNKLCFKTGQKFKIQGVINENPSKYSAVFL